MAVEIFPSSFRCDCGKELDFSEGTIKAMERMSSQKRTRLGDAKHTIVFDKGEAVEIRCPKKGIRTITGYE